MSTGNVTDLVAAAVLGSAAVSGALASATHAVGETVQLPLIGSVSAPLGFALSNAVATLALGAITYEGDLPAFITNATTERKAIVYLQTLNGLGQSAVMKGLATNQNVGLAESFLHGFISPLVTAELLTTFYGSGSRTRY
jgi:hypothetical protein